MYKGSFKESLAKSSTFWVWVAENRIVCLYVGSAFIIWVKSYSNPWRRRASASSITRERRLWWIHFEFWRWSRSLPGVQIRRLTPFYSLILSAFLFIPPIKRPIVLLWKWPSFLATSKTWIASYLVGVIIITPVPFFCLN